MFLHFIHVLCVNVWSGHWKHWKKSLCFIILLLVCLFVFTGFFYFYFKCYSHSRFPRHKPTIPSSFLTSLRVFSSPSSPSCLPPQHSPTLRVQHWQDQGLPLPLVAQQVYSLLPMQLQPWVSPCIVFKLWCSPWELWFLPWLFIWRSKPLKFFQSFISSNGGPSFAASNSASISPPMNILVSPFMKEWRRNSHFMSFSFSLISGVLLLSSSSFCSSDSSSFSPLFYF